ncbi:MAG: MBL fold metallo-hydrolase [Hyphomicrobiaceae bacterium]
MPDMVAVDRVEITVVVDNVTDNLSSTPQFVVTEVRARDQRTPWVMAGDCLCCAAHGLSCVVTTWRGETKHSLLFDAGPDPAVFERNATRLSLDLGAVEAMVLSHGHWDHGGGMIRALEMIKQQGGGRPVTYYAHPEMFNRRSGKLPDGSFREMADVPKPEELKARGADVVVTRDAQAALDGHVYVSGEIPRLTAYETGLPGQHRRTADGTGWEPDELLTDERFIAINVKGKGLIVLTACSHAGVINVLTEARAKFPNVPLYAVMGGLHLSGTNERVIPQTVEALGGFGLTHIVAGHCTGWRAQVAIANRFGDGVLVPLAVGKRFTF